MDFFAHQEAAQRRTKLLLFYYTVAVILLVLAVYAATVLVFVWMGRSEREVPLWDASLFGWVTAGTLAVVFLGSTWRTAELRRGGKVVAEMLGGRPVPLEPNDQHERRLRNVIEEMAIASGTTVPEIYLLDRENGINAFAAGHTTADAAIGVTRGCMRQLSRDELQGVMAHEFSHILNGDMRLNMRLIGVLHGILCLYLIGRVLLRVRSRSSGSSKKGGNPLPLFGLLLIVIGSAGVFFGRLIQAAVSRQREFLADAAAVQFTRNPSGIAGALKKIGGSTRGSKLVAAQANATSHLFFGNGVAASWFGLMATHPPLVERIRRIDPSFTGEFSRVSESAVPEEMAPPPVSAAPGVSALAGFAPAPAVNADQATQLPGQIVSLRYAAGVIDSLPPSVRAAAHDPLGAVALMFALVLSHVAEVRAQQKTMIEANAPTVAAAMSRLAAELEGMETHARLPLLSLCLPALRTLPFEEWRRQRALLEQVVACDAQIDLFEFVVKRIIERQVDRYWHPRKSIIQHYSFAALADDCAVLLSALAHVGAAEVDQVKAAFQRGATRLPLRNLTLRAPEACGVGSIDAALNRLAEASPPIKRAVLEACAQTVATDNLISGPEAELLRAVADALECPMPPFIQGV